MHHIYTTPAFVIHSAPHGEAGKFLLLFTRDFGMIGAIAQGIRYEKSKLRYHVQDSNLLEVSIVRGKEVWRLTGASEYFNNKTSLLKLKILKLLKRLLHGEEKNEKLFEIIENLYKTEINDTDEVLECLIVIRILNVLGYIKNDSEINSFLENNEINIEILQSFSKIKSKAIHIVNHALKESQL